MTRYEFLKSNRSLIKLLVDNIIDPKDVEYLPIFEEFNEMRSKKHKVVYIIVHLCEKYGKSERTMYKIIGRMKKKVKL